MNLRGELQVQCEVTHAEQDNSLPLVTVEAKFFTEKRPSGYGGCTYADELELSLEISLADMADGGDEPQQAWQVLKQMADAHDIPIAVETTLERSLIDPTSGEDLRVADLTAGQRGSEVFAGIGRGSVDSRRYVCKITRQTKFHTPPAFSAPQQRRTLVSP